MPSTEMLRPKNKNSRKHTQVNKKQCTVYRKPRIRGETKQFLLNIFTEKMINTHTLEAQDG